METQEELGINAEFIEKLKAHDRRWVEIEKAIKIEEELRSSEALKAVLEVVNEEAVLALEEMVAADPTDRDKMISLQAKVRRARIIGNTLEAIRKKGAFAQASLQDEGTVHVE